MSGPQRIVCLTEEPTEVLYALGEERRIVGISGFTVRPPRARKEKPKVSAFTSAKIEAILALQPDFVVGFSDIQADIARDLVRAGVEVWIANHRSVDGILDYVLRLGALVDASDAAAKYVDRARAHIAEIERAAAKLSQRPRVYFEEWDDPLISGIRWVEELIEIVGGQPIFPELRNAKLGKDRIVDAADVIRRDPQVIIASWCGKPVRPARISGRAGWEAIDAIRHGHVYEVKSALILQPGPAALTDGVRALQAHITRAATEQDPARG
jgi:iron complex transport system substrate-binding protein